MRKKTKRKCEGAIKLIGVVKRGKNWGMWEEKINEKRLWLEEKKCISEKEKNKREGWLGRIRWRGKYIE
jgi:hypothetical protein